MPCLCRFYIPYFYIPEFAKSLGLEGALPFYCLTVMNASGILGRLILSFISDKIGRYVHITLHSILQYPLNVT